MDEQTVWTTAPAMGPFLTLLVLIATRQRTRTENQTMCGATHQCQIFGDETMSVKAPPAHSGPVALGPFLTLILTLRRSRPGSDGFCRQRASLPRGAMTACAT
jgi:hypothetical protein